MGYKIVGIVESQLCKEHWKETGQYVNRNGLWEVELWVVFLSPSPMSPSLSFTVLSVFPTMSKYYFDNEEKFLQRKACN